jgi:CRISPR-associated endonuclease/helicase Cas3
MPLFDTYWGKAATDYVGKFTDAQGTCKQIDEAHQGPPVYHLMAHHSLDVAAVAQRLLERVPLFQAKLANFFELDPSRVISSIAALCAIHDLGKLDWRFVMKARAAGIVLDPSRSVCPETKGYDHGSAGFAFVRMEGPEKAAFGACFGEPSLSLFRAVTGHHGSLPERDSPSVSLHAGEVMQSPQLQSITRTDRLARAEFLRAVTSIFLARGAELPMAKARKRDLSAGVWFLAGVCSVADWIGSNSDYFHYSAFPQDLGHYYESCALPAANRALDALNWLEAKPTGAEFAKLFPFSPRGIQSVAANLALPPGPTMVIVEAAMGEGKTETALTLASQFLGRGDAAGMYVALPTMATANGLFGRVADAVPRLFQGVDSKDINLLLLHGRSRSNTLYDSIIRRTRARSYQETNLRGDRPAEAIAGQWFLEGRKRKLLAELGVGTVDQALQAVLRLSHGFVRLFGLAKSVVVVDEVHAYDVYMEVLLERLVMWLGALGAPMILLSATLPRARKEKLAQAYRDGLGWAKEPAKAGRALTAAARAQNEERNRAAARIELPSAAYPLMTVIGETGASEHKLPAEAPTTVKRVRIHLLSTEGAEAEALRMLVDCAKAGAACCWIRNTVRDAQSVFKSLRAGLGDSVELFHARFTVADRGQREKDVLARFGKDPAAKAARKGRVLVATQVVEQSLDLDFDLLISDIAPIDLLLQRAGRLHRHPRAGERFGYEEPHMYIVLPEPERLAKLDYGGSGKVYDPVTLDLARDSLHSFEEHLVEIPTHLRTLVEATYDPKIRAERIGKAGNRAQLERAEQELNEEIETRQEKAMRGCIPSPSSAAGPIEDYEDTEEALEALTRDGDSCTLCLLRYLPESGELATFDNAKALELNPASPKAFKELERILEQAVGLPKYPWEYPLQACDPPGEAQEWTHLETKLRGFLAAFKRSDLLCLPLVARGGEYRGSYRASNNRRIRASYTKNTGLITERED